MPKRLALAFVAVVLLSAGLLFVRPPQARAVYAISPIILLHGFNSHSAQDCNISTMWGTVKGYLQSHGMTNVLSLGYYLGDTHCDQYILDNSHCSSWYPGNFGTVNEDIRHTTCNIAWWIWNNYSQYGTTAGVIPHSMGGILIRQILNDTPYYPGIFPPYLIIYDVATAGTPHQGLTAGAAALPALGAFFSGCWSPCLEVMQMERVNPLMSNLNSKDFRKGWARNPQGNGGTDWTNLASNNDGLLYWGCTSSNETMGAPSAVYNTTACGLMPGAKHFVVYPGCCPYYDHGGYLTDTNTTWDARECYSDNTGGTWYCVSTSEHSIFTMHYGILYSSW